MLCCVSSLSFLGLWKCHVVSVAMQIETLECCVKKRGWREQKRELKTEQAEEGKSNVQNYIYRNGPVRNQPEVELVDSRTLTAIFNQHGASTAKFLPAYY